MLKIEDLHFLYRKHGPAVLSGVSLTLAPGEVGILLGKNGAGKTTLFKSILGLERPTKGRITLCGRELSTLSRRERAKEIAYVPQDIRFGALTVTESVLLGRLSHFGLRPGPLDYALTERVLWEMGLSALADRNVCELSGGEQQKVAIARALAQEPRLMVFDEPTGNLDIANGQLILREARRLAKEKQLAVLCSLHDLNAALAFGDRFFLLGEGTVRYSGGREAVTAAAVKDIFGVDVRIESIDGHPVVLPF
jgi:iron complex transport system ATP-binding protein